MIEIAVAPTEVVGVIIYQGVTEVEINQIEMLVVVG